MSPIPRLRNPFDQPRAATEPPSTRHHNDSSTWQNISDLAGSRDDSKSKQDVSQSEDNWGNEFNEDSDDDDSDTPNDLQADNDASIAGPPHPRRLLQHTSEELARMISEIAHRDISGLPPAQPLPSPATPTTQHYYRLAYDDTPTLPLQVAAGQATASRYFERPHYMHTVWENLVAEVEYLRGPEQYHFVGKGWWDSMKEAIGVMKRNSEMLHQGKVAFPDNLEQALVEFDKIPDRKKRIQRLIRALEFGGTLEEDLMHVNEIKHFGDQIKKIIKAVERKLSQG
ncbi:hypothetical protein NA57DRAFT_76353 [Rhizodiscina lignyota]|uniref:Uncharacterized protein n=1 Tax=Rhizodiscina lignyota TaxID=1504668 RepID=A0A9P4IH06_9PEZI|nr:hypothetical protein NA57DRAFT_76353 [Rhizodiscina lignyota]